MGPLGVLSQIRGHAELFKDLIRHPDRVLGGGGHDHRLAGR